jgi:hypothetical protein
MAITIEDIRKAYSNTHVARNGVNLEEIFEKNGHNVGGYWIDVYNAVYYILEAMSSSSKFSVNCLFSDGGVKDYMVMYKWNDYYVIISREFYMGQHTNFKTVQDLCVWLNNHENNIITGSKPLLTKEEMI